MNRIISPTEECTAFLQQCVPNDFEMFMDACQRYGQLLYEINESLNLTSIPPEDFWSKHIADSASLLRYFSFREMRGIQLCDLGCGGGLPALVLAAACPNIHVTAIDSRGKKIVFVNQAISVMGLHNARALHARANELGYQAEHKHHYHFVTARAVGEAQILIRESVNLLNREGSLLVYRTKTQAQPEMEELLKQKDGPACKATETLELPDHAGTRMFLQIQVNKKRSFVHTESKKGDHAPQE